MKDFEWAVSVGTGAPGSGGPVTSGTPVGGVDYTEDQDDQNATTGAITITVAKNASYCSKAANHTATVVVTATTQTNAARSGVLVPDLAANHDTNPNNTDNAANAGDWRNRASFEFDVVCPAASSSSQGVELVPENLFPTDK